MINEFMPDYAPILGGWSNYLLGLTYPYMFVFDVTNIPNYEALEDCSDLPIVKAIKIPSFREVLTKQNKVWSGYFRGYKFESFGTFYHRDFYVMFVFVTKQNKGK